ncbi:MAG TPA: ComEC/Rec2 family competence protein [Plantibacter sp.]|uniref:ComEC/Rec2 family competence protein n=1 Tax=unclassified Plantibacter TaxID=2624265 RepID=UPI002B864B49|nr:ComEC/Rec2 family competence protein [Plantibacter sp.]
MRDQTRPDPGSAPDLTTPASPVFPRLLVPAACAWIGGALCIGTPSTAPLVAVLTFALAALSVGWVLVVRRGATGAMASGHTPILLGACCLAAVGLVAASVSTHAPGRQPFELRAQDGSTLIAELVVTADGLRSGSGSSEPSMRFSADLVASTEGAHRRDGFAVPIMVFAPTIDDRVPRIGEHWVVSGSLRWNEPADARAALMFASVSAERVAGPPDLIAWAGALRAGLVAVAERLPGAGGELLPGLAIGDVSRVGETIGTAMQLSSLSHLTAVSGANCALIVWLVTAAATRLGAGRVLRLVLALAALAAFVVIVTPQPSVQRAALMATLVLVMGGFGRPARGLAALSIAVIVLLVTDPWLAGQYGFGLSVLATAGLLLLSRPLTDVLSRWIPRRLAILIAVPTAAQLACQPMLVLLDPAIQLAGVPANLLAGPAAAPATLLGLVACLVALVSTPIAIGVAWLGWLPATWIAAVAQSFASASAARLPWPEGPPGVALLAIPTVAIATLLLFRQDLPRVVSRALGIGLLLFAVIVGAGSVGAVLGTALHRPNDWVVAACDVGQGDAVLVRGGGAVALVDVGPDPAPLRACLDDLGIRRIDLLVLSHYDADHVGGLEAVLGDVVDVLVGPFDDPTDERIVRALQETGAVVYAAAAGDEGVSGDAADGLRWRVLWPDPAAGRVAPGNDASVVVRFELPEAAVLLLGDLGEEAQDRLLARHRIGSAVDIVKVSHHGSADQSERLARRIGATVAVVSVGADNGYGHPTRSALELYESTGGSVVRTDQLGTILIAPSGDDGFRVWSPRSPAAPDVDVGARR